MKDNLKKIAAVGHGGLSAPTALVGGGTGAYGMLPPRSNHDLEPRFKDQGKRIEAINRLFGIKTKFDTLKTVTNERLSKIPQDIKEGKPLKEEEKNWIKSVAQTGNLVKILSLGKIGKVIQGAKDPVEGKGLEKMALVSYEDDGKEYHKWYDSKELEPVKKSEISKAEEFFNKNIAPSMKG